MLNFAKGLGLGFLCLILFVLGVIFNVEFLNKSSNIKEFSFQRSINIQLNETATNFSSKIIFWLNKNLSTKYELSQDDKTNIANSFEDITKLIKESNICKGGSYELMPTFSYKDGVKIPNGYELNANLTCDVNKENLNSYNELLIKLENIAKNSSSFSMSVPSLNPKLSKEEINSLNEKLYDKLLEKSLALSSYYSTKLNKNCQVKSINSYSTDPYLLRNSNVLPNNQENTYQISANVMFICN